MRITYLFDPLCGWCYGAGPAIERLAGLDGVSVELAPTGLFAGEGARPMDTHFAAYAWQNDQRIARLTGQPFTETYRTRVLAALGSMFDSAPATIGLVAVGLGQPERELEALKTLQHARYVDGRNITTLAAVADVLAEAGFAAAADGVRVPDQNLLQVYRQRTTAAREQMARFGADGVPALLIGEAGDRRLLRTGGLFGRFELLAEQLQAA
ncbi:DsbA family protein [Devosia sp. CN2-171]|uniref:DsbA family protein n=1 Tax=Devosia sp. CN2-171 TaxID=3400909 RepID=UPI003BF7DB79